MRRYDTVKRCLDVVCSILALLVLWPVLVLIAAAVRLESKGTVLFRQERLGRNGRVFTIYKYRTMLDGAIHMGSGLFTHEGDTRITRVGAFLRKTSLDELPQLINIVKGEMSLVGPRPPVPYYPRRYEQYGEEQKRRFLVRPGITGLAQVRVRNGASWDERIVLDIQYVERMSLLLDISLILQTILIVLKRKNIYVGEKGGKPQKTPPPSDQ